MCSMIPQPIRWEIYDTLQMILGILRPHGRVSSSPAPVAGMLPQAGAHSVHQWKRKREETKEMKKQAELREEAQEMLIESFIRRERKLVETLEEKKKKSEAKRKKERWKSWKHYNSQMTREE